MRINETTGLAATRNLPRRTGGAHSATRAHHGAGVCGRAAHFTDADRLAGAAHLQGGRRVRLVADSVARIMAGGILETGPWGAEFGWAHPQNIGFHPIAIVGWIRHIGRL